MALGEVRQILVFLMSNSKSNLSSGTYRLRTVFKVYNENNSEAVEKINSKVMAKIERKLFA